MSYRHPPRTKFPVSGGIPLAFMEEGALYNFETFLGDEISSRSAQQYVLVNAAGIAASFPVPDTGDGITRGQLRMIGTAAPAPTFAGLRRQENNGIAADGFTAANPTLCAIRFRMNSAIPTAADDYFASPGGLVGNVAGSLETNDGVYPAFDRTVASWVLKAARAGVRIQNSLSLAWDANYHTMGFLHRGTHVTGFRNGEVIGASMLTGPEIQPSVGVRAEVAHMVQIAAAMAFNGDMDVDWILWGPV